MADRAGQGTIVHLLDQELVREDFHAYTPEEAAHETRANSGARGLFGPYAPLPGLYERERARKPIIARTDDDDAGCRWRGIAKILLQGRRHQYGASFRPRAIGLDIHSRRRRARGRRNIDPTTTMPKTVLLGCTKPLRPRQSGGLPARSTLADGDRRGHRVGGDRAQSA